MRDLLNFRGGGERNIKKYRSQATYNITPKGMSELDDMDAEGSEITILAAMAEKRRPMAVSDIAREARMSTDDCMRYLSAMDRKGSVQRLNTKMPMH